MKYVLGNRDENSEASDLSKNLHLNVTSPMVLGAI